MDQKNPYYLHQENQMKTINTQSKRQNQSSPYNPFSPKDKPQNSSQQSNNMNPYQQSNLSQYPPLMQYSYQPPQYPPLPYNPAPMYPYSQPQQPYPPYQRQNQYSLNSGSSNQLTFDHCPFCNKMTNSIVQQKPIFIAWIVCFLLFCFTVLLFWLPFCFQSCKERRFKCVNCKRVKFVIKNSC